MESWILSAVTTPALRIARKVCEAVMHDNSTQSNQNLPPPSGWDKIIFLLVALIQAPFALLTLNTDRLAKLIVQPTAQHHWTRNEIRIGLIIFSCCLFAGIGLLDGYRKKTLGTILGGILIGLVLFAVDFYMTAFLGCCLEIFKLGH
jgi:hypothetical protein